MEAVMDTFDDEAFHGPDMKTKAEVRKDQNGKEEDSRSAAWVQTFEVLEENVCYSLQQSQSE
ncbi:hypothetical protein Scep_007019 [Stephania cephalantha]|uniref:Uncharacterized protein n=1 Tax=Stephania cephalantha TaxID=152367 RepID=A0AAP0KBM5_9MAGN